MHPNEALLRSYYDAVARGDLGTVEQMYADDVVVHAPPGSPLAGDYRGKDEVFGFLGEVMERSGGTLRFDVHDVLANDEHGVALLRASADHADKTLDDNAVHVIHIKGGKLSEFWGLWGDPHAFDAFFS